MSDTVIVKTKPSKPPKPKRPAVNTWRTKKRDWLLRRLAHADEPSYDQLCEAVASRFPVSGPSGPYITLRESVRAVRDLLWDGLATTENDESVWLTPSGWQALERLRDKAARRVR